LRHVTRRQARLGRLAAIARTASGRLSSLSWSGVGGRLRPGLREGTTMRGVPRKTVSVDEMPMAYGSRNRCSVRRNVALSPNSASPSTAVT
jgi:hypothetical protein